MAKQLTVTLPDEVHDELLALAYAQRLELPELVERLVGLYGFMRDFCVGQLTANDGGRLGSSTRRKPPPS